MVKLLTVVSRHTIFRTFFEPLVKIPLIIFERGQSQRQDIHTITSCIDLLPTLLHYTDHQISSELPGKILPPFAAHDTQ